MNSLLRLFLRIQNKLNLDQYCPSSEKKQQVPHRISLQSNDFAPFLYLENDGSLVPDEIPYANGSKYDEHFHIYHLTKRAVCRICGKVVRKNCFGMRRHLLVKHQIIVKDIPKSSSPKPMKIKSDVDKDNEPTIGKKHA